MEEAKKKSKIFLDLARKKLCHVVEHIFLSNFAIRPDFPRRVFRAVEALEPHKARRSHIIQYRNFFFLLGALKFGEHVALD